MLVPFLVVTVVSGAAAQAHSAPTPIPKGAKSTICKTHPVPQFTDVTRQSGIRFVHTAAPEKKFIVESMSGGVIILDYDRDGWPDLYFTNSPTVAMALKRRESEKRALPQ